MTDTKFDVDSLIVERATTHGDYLKNADITWKIKDALHEGTRYDSMHPAMRETLDMVAHKMHRIVNGDPFFRDHWVDIEGYAHLIVQNWDRLMEWRGNLVVEHGLVTIDVAVLREHGLEVIDGRLMRCMTTAQEVMARDRVGSRPPRPAPEPVAPPLDRPEAAPARVVPGPRSERVADAGGPVVLSDIEEQEPVLPSQEQREPIAATYKEWESIRLMRIARGSETGRTWGYLYTSQNELTGRYHMLGAYRAEYGR